MSSIIQESALGQILRFSSGNKIYRYPEEDPNFPLPWSVLQQSEKGSESPEESGLDQEPKTTAMLDDRADISIRDPEAQISSGTGEALDTAPARRLADGTIIVGWYSPDDPSNPQNWNSWKKAFVAFQIFVYTFAVYSGGSIFTSAEPQIMEQFNISQTKASLGLSMYVLGYGVGPMIFSPLSEVPAIGRNLPYVTSFALFLILCVPTALVNNYAGLLVLRFLTGFMGSPCLATGGATMQDMYGILKIPYALTAWVAAAFAAPAAGPLLSGFSVVVEGWRWSMWEVLWLAAPVFIFMFTSMPETSASNILHRRAQRLRKLTGNPNIKSQGEIDQGNSSLLSAVATQLLIPTEMMFQDPAVFFVNIYTSLIYGTYYSFFEAFPIVYLEVYGFNLGELGIVFLCIAIGCVIGIAIYVSYLYWYLEPDIKKNGLGAQEQRLVPALYSTILLPAGMFWFAWTAKASIHWIVSIIGITFYAVGAFILFQCLFMYLPLTYPQYAASLFAANDLSRSALAAGSILYAEPLYRNLGIGRGISLLAGLLCGGVLGIWAIWYYGARLRARSRFALS